MGNNSHLPICPIADNGFDFDTVKKHIKTFRKQTSKKFLPTPSKIFFVNFIVRATCSAMNISIPDLQKNSRKREYVYARHMFKILVSCGSSLSMATIGSMAGMKEHSSIIHSKDNLSGLLTDHHFRDPLSIVLKRIEKDGRFKKEIMKMITERPELEDFFEKKPMYEREEIFHKMNAFLHEHGAIILMDAFPGFFEKSFPGEKIPALIPIS